MDGWTLDTIIVITVYFLATTAILMRFIGREIDALSRRIDRLVDEVLRRQMTGD